FPSASKAPGHQAAGVTALGRVCARVRLRVLAIGGISLDRIIDVAAAGAAGIAAIGLFTNTRDLERIVTALRQGFPPDRRAI
ncbi:MAG: thiamine phosphate synthase, partial [Acidobacteriota bacterium]